MTKLVAFICDFKLEFLCIIVSDKWRLHTTNVQMSIYPIFICIYPGYLPEDNIQGILPITTLNSFQQEKHKRTKGENKLLRNAQKLLLRITTEENAEKTTSAL